MAATSNYDLPYPGPSDTPDGAAQMQALAEKVDTELLALSSRVKAYSAASTTSQTLTATKTDVPGTSLTITTQYPNAQAIVTAVFDLSRDGTTGSEGNHLIGYLLVDSVEQAGQALLRAVANARATVSQTYVVPLVAAGTHTIKLRVSTSATVGTQVVNAPHTRWSAIVIDGGA